MWQANLTEWYEENPDGDNLKKEENPAVGDNLKGIAGRHRLGGDGHDGGKPRRGTTSRRKTPPSGTTSRGIAGRHRLGGDGHGGGKRGTTSRRRKTEGDNLMRGRSRENPDFGENLDGGMEDDAGDGNAAQAGDIGAYYFGSGGWGWLPFAYDSFEFRQCSWDREVWKGRLARISWLQVIMYAWGTWKV
ncbi:hypothetical protein PAPYR_12413 [Paratrimastix pyriformis]|uniref:Uncharacterized protein n=1 Tax=Paratrimastix pyriformis TaxID=342808 RepID=A0ABQ8U1Y1_9EUKA|nr:hypothetical protein PAPYR_12413 [Paratrimastix pyriformis]